MPSVHQWAPIYSHFIFSVLKTYVENENIVQFPNSKQKYNLILIFKKINWATCSYPCSNCVRPCGWTIPHNDKTQTKHNERFFILSTSYILEKCILMDPKCNLAVLYDWAHLNAWGVVFAAQLLNRGASHSHCPNKAKQQQFKGKIPGHNADGPWWRLTTGMARNHINPYLSCVKTSFLKIDWYIFPNWETCKRAA